MRGDRRCVGPATFSVGWSPWRPGLMGTVPGDARVRLAVQARPSLPSWTVNGPASPSADPGRERDELGV